MFLKQGTFNYEKQSVVLSELSGLQRIEYLAFVQQRTAKFDAEEGELPEAERQIAQYAGISRRLGRGARRHGSICLARACAELFRKKLTRFPTRKRA